MAEVLNHNVEYARGAFNHNVDQFTHKQNMKLVSNNIVISFAKNLCDKVFSNFVLLISYDVFI